MENVNCVQILGSHLISHLVTCALVSKMMITILVVAHCIETVEQAQVKDFNEAKFSTYNDITYLPNGRISNIARIFVTQECLSLQLRILNERVCNTINLSAYLVFFLF